MFDRSDTLSTSARQERDFDSSDRHYPGSWMMTSAII